MDKKIINSQLSIINYTTKSGDYWDLIAKLALGSEKYSRDLMRANPELLGIIKFQAGVKIKIPEVEKIPRKAVPWK